MNIFQSIKEGQEIIFLTNKNITEIKKIDEDSYNPLTYAISIGNNKAAQDIISFMKNNSEKNFLSDTVSNVTLLNNIMWKLKENSHIVKSIISTFELDKKQQNYFLSVINMNLYIGRDYSYEEIYPYIPIKKFNSYEELKKLDQSIYCFEEYAHKIVNFDFDAQLKVYKDFVLNYDKYYQYTILQKNDTKREQLKEFIDKIDSLILNINNQEDLYALLDSLGATMNNNFNTYKDKSIFFANTRGTHYLKEDVSRDKINFYRELYENFKENNSLEDAFSYILSRYLKNREEIDITQLNILLEEKRFKSITIDKDADINKIVEVIRLGSYQVESIFNIESQDVGATKLSLLFTFEESKQDGVAAFTPSSNLITYYLNSLRNTASRDFVHEFTHYLQDSKFCLNNVSYDEKGKFDLHDNDLWQDINKALDKVTSDKEDVLEYSRNVLKQLLKDLPIQHEKFIISILPHIDNTDNEAYTRTITTALSSLLTSETPLDDNYYFNNQIISPQKFNDVINRLSLIHKAHHSDNFLKNMWIDADKMIQRDYHLNTFEIHSRLTEKLTEIKDGDNVTDLAYPTDKMMKVIKPHLEKFNQMLVTHYKDYIVPYRSSNNSDAHFRKIEDNFNIKKMRNKYTNLTHINQQNITR